MKVNLKPAYVWHCPVCKEQNITYDDPSDFTVDDIEEVECAYCYEVFDIDLED